MKPKTLTEHTNLCGTWTMTIMLLIVISSFCGVRQINAQTKAPAKDEAALTDARIANQKAQQEYYSTQTQLLKQRPVDPHSQQPVSPNFPGIIGAIGASIAAIVALVSFVLNYRAAMRNQKDMQFYEALKRFGDPSSPSVRASATTLITQIGAECQTKLDWIWVCVPRLTKGRPYLAAAVDQLIAGLPIETNDVVIDSIKNALEHLVPLSLEQSIALLYRENCRAQRDVVAGLIRWKSMRSPNEQKPRTALIVGDGNDWRILHSLTKFDLSVLDDLETELKWSMEDEYIVNAYANSEVNEQIVTERLTSAGLLLRQASGRLRITIVLLSNALRLLRSDHGSALDLCTLFLVGADLSGARLKGANLQQARLQQALLVGTDLESASLVHANCSGGLFKNTILRCADLTSCNLKGYGTGDCSLDGVLEDSETILGPSDTTRTRYSTCLDGADVADTKFGFLAVDNERTKFIKVNWWRADYEREQGNPNRVLIERLVQLEPDVMNKHRNEWHSSVQKYMEIRKVTAPNEPKTSKTDVK